MLYGKNVWGPKAWHLLHAFSINKLKITDEKKNNYNLFYKSFVYILPCEICSSHYYEIINYIDPILEEDITRKYLIKWVFNIHNLINNLLDKPIYSFSNLKDKEYSINNKDIIFIIDAVYSNFNYDSMSLFKYDQIYIFFLNFCILYPNLKIRKILKKLIKSSKFKEIETPIKFKEWYNNTFKKYKSIFVN